MNELLADFFTVNHFVFFCTSAKRKYNLCLSHSPASTVDRAPTDEQPTIMHV